MFKKNSRLKVSFVAVVLAVLAYAQTVLAKDDGVSEYITVPAGSYIIDMCHATPSFGNSLKPYGMVFDFVQNNQIPVYWAINPNKTSRGQADFSIDGRTFCSGSFIIDAVYANTPAAQAVIATWEAKGVIGYTTQNTATNIPTYDPITSFPRAVLDDANGSIAEGYLENAEISPSFYEFKPPALLDQCDDVYTMPHADPTWEEHENLINHVQQGGGIWAACHAVSVLELVDDPGDPDLLPDMNFLSGDNGLIDFGDHDGGTPPYSYALPAHPIMQFLGDIGTATENGSEQIYLPQSTGWRTQTSISMWDEDHPEVLDGTSPGKAAKIAFGRAYGSLLNGFVMYEGGHSHNKGSTPDYVGAQRAYLNFMLLVGIDRRPEIETAIRLESTGVIVTELDSGTRYLLEATPGFSSYNWTSTCGGTFDSPTSSTTVYTAPITALDLDCSIQVLVADSCGRTNNSFNVTTIIGKPDLAIEKTDTLDPVAVDGSYAYELTITNNGSDATDITVTDTLPVGVSYAGFSGSGWSCTAAGQEITCTLASLAYQATSTVTIDVTAPPTAGSVTNTASVFVDGDFDPTNNTATEETRFLTATDLFIQKSGPGYNPECIASPAPTHCRETEETYSYTLQAGNNGPFDATSVTVTDVLPTGMTYVSATGTGWFCGFTASTNTVSCARPAITVGEIVPPITLTVTPTGDLLPPGDTTVVVPNTATIASADFADSNPADNSSTVDVTIFSLLAADLGVTKTVDKSDAQDGDTVLFTLTTENFGPDPAETVVVVDEFIYSLNTSGFYDFCRDSNYTFELVRADGSTFTSGGTGGDRIVVLDGVTFTVSYANVTCGDPNADAPTIAPTDGSSVQILWTLEPGLEPGDSVAVAFEATKAGDTAADNDVSVFSNTTDLNSTNNADSVTLEADIQEVDLGVTKAVDPSTANPGDTVLYTFSVFNSNASDDNLKNLDATTPVTFLDPLPTGMTLVGVQTYSKNDPATLVQDCTWTGTTLSCSTPATADSPWNCSDTTATQVECDWDSTLENQFDKGASYQIVVIAKAPDEETVLNNTATISYTHPLYRDNTSSNDSDSASLTLTPLDTAADLILYKNVDKDDASGGDVVFSFTVENLGPDTANFVVVTDTDLVEPDYIFKDPPVVSQGTAVLDTAGSGLSWTVGTMDANTTATLTVEVTLGSPTTSPGLTNTATVDANENDPNTANNTDSATILSGVTEADIGVYKYDLADPSGSLATDDIIDTHPAGTDLQYVVHLENFGGENLNDLDTADATLLPLMVDTLPTGATLKTIEIFARDNSALVDPKVETCTWNGATLSCVFDDPNNDQAWDCTASTGSEIRCQWDPLRDGGDNSWDNGHTYEMLITVATDAVQQQLVNNISIDYAHNSYLDNNAQNDSDAETTQLYIPVDLAVTKTVAAVGGGALPDPLKVGDQVEFTLSAENLSPDFAATNVVLTDLLPAELSYVSSTGDGSYNAGAGIWTIPTIATSSTASLTLVAEIASFGDPVDNTLALADLDQRKLEIVNGQVVPSADIDQDPANNSSTASITVTPVDLAVAKVAYETGTTTPVTGVNLGDTVDFLVTVTNNGPVDETSIVITDLLPSQLGFVSATGDGTYDSATGAWSVPSLAVGATASLTITATVVTAGDIVNTATRTSADHSDNVPDNDSASATITGLSADLAVSKSVSPQDVNLSGTGEQAVFSVVVSNNGPTYATGIQVTDLLPAGTTYVSHSITDPNAEAGDGYDDTSGLWVVGRLESGESATLAITVTVDILGTITNSAAISASDVPDPVPSNNSDSADVFSGGQADIEIAKQASDTLPVLGDQITYTITATNLGPNPATNLVVEDVLPAGVSYVSSTTSIDGDPLLGGSYDGTSLWTIGDLAVGSSAELLITVDTTVAGLQTNTASVSSVDQGDPDTTNNSFSRDITIQAAATFAVSKVTLPAAAAATQFPFVVYEDPDGDGIFAANTTLGFELDTDGDDADGATTASGPVSVTPDVYVIEESATAGWLLQDLACTVNAGTPTLTYGAISAGTFTPGGGAAFAEGDTAVRLDLQSGDDVSCIAVNHESATIEIIKQLIPTDDGGTFDLLLDGTTVFAAASDGDTTGLLPVLLGTAPASSFQISEAAAGSPSTLEPYEISWRCLDGAGDILVDDTVTGAAFTGFTVDIATTDATIRRSAAQKTVTCTITNARGSKVIISKVASPVDGTDFAFTSVKIGGGNNQIGDFTLDNEVTDTDGILASAEFQVSPNTAYDITESEPPAGWALTEISCLDSNDNSNVDVANRLAQIVVDPGDNIECTFYNVRQGSLTITKVTDVADSTFGFDRNLDGDAVDPEDLTLTTASNTASQTFTGLTPNEVYTFDELVPCTDDDCWVLVDISCVIDSTTGSGTTTFEYGDVSGGIFNGDGTFSAGETAAAVTLGPGDDVTCTFTNQSRTADLVIEKTSLTGDYTPGSSDTYTLTVTNNGPAAVTGALVADQLPVGASLDGSWSCTPDTTGGDASCISGQPSGTAASGSGNLSQLVDIAVGGVLVFEIPVIYSDDPTVYP